MSACSLRSVMAVRFLARYPRTRACSFTSDLRARSAFRACVARKNSKKKKRTLQVASETEKNWAGMSDG
jgi:hypothetical protein